jgi:hypothetical protein
MYGESNELTFFCQRRIGYNDIVAIVIIHFEVLLTRWLGRFICVSCVPLSQSIGGSENSHLVQRGHVHRQPSLVGTGEAYM